MASTKQGFYKRGSVWWLRTDPVTKKPISTKCTSFEAASKFRERRELLNANPAHVRSLEAKFGDWCSRFISMKERDSSPATVGYCREKLGPALRIWGAELRLVEIDAALLDDYVSQRREERLSEHTISKEVSMLTQVLKLAKRGMAYGGDLETLRPLDLHANYVPRARALTAEEVRAIRASASPRCAALVAVCVALGCRLSEALKLAPEDVSLAAGHVHIRGTKTDESDRRVPILSLFRSLLEEAAPLLPLGPDPKHRLAHEIRRVCIRLELPHVSPNDLRRTHATWLLESGVEPDIVRRLLGHTTTRLVDQVYGRPAPEAIGALAEAKLEKVLQLRASAPETVDENTTPRRPCRPFRCSPSEPACDGFPGNTRVATRRSKWRRVATGTKSLHGIWLGRRGRAVA